MAIFKVLKLLIASMIFENVSYDLCEPKLTS